MEAVPTDGLGITKSDLDQIGVKSYLEVDRILQSVINGKKETTILNAYKVIERYHATKYKRQNPYIFKREKIV